MTSAPPSILRAYLNSTLKHLNVTPQWGQGVKDFWSRIQNDLDKLEKGSKIAQ